MYIFNQARSRQIIFSALYAPFCLLLLLVSLISTSSTLLAQNTLSSDPGPNAVWSTSPTIPKGNSDPCAAISKIDVETVHYKSFSAVRIHPDGINKELEIKDSRGRTLQRLNLERGAQMLKTKFGEELVIHGTNRCGKVGPLQTINVGKRPEGAPITMNQEVFDALYQWQQRPGKVNVCQFVAELLPADRFTRLSIAQQLIHKGKPFADEFSGTRAITFPTCPPPPPPPGPDDNEDDCSCQILEIAPTQNLVDYDGVSDEEALIVLEDDDHHYWADNRGQRNRDWLLQGPARRKYLKAETRRDRCLNATNGRRAYTFNSTNDVNFNDAADDISMTSWAQVGYLLFCVDQVHYPSDCGCERDVQFEWTYLSHVESNAETPGSGVFCGGTRRAAAQTVDFAMVTMTETEGTDITVTLIDTMFNGVSSGCEASYTGPGLEEFVPFFSAVGNVVSLFTDNDEDDEEAPGVEEYIEAFAGLLTPLADLFDEPWQTVEGECSPQERTDNLGSGTPDVTGEIPVGNYVYRLRPGVRAVLTMAAGESMQVRGERRWKAESAVTSSFSLASGFRGGTDSEFGAHCCTPFYGNFMLGNLDGRYSAGNDDDHPVILPSLVSLQGMAESFFQSYGISSASVDGQQMIGERFRDLPNCRIEVPRGLQAPNNSLTISNVRPAFGTIDVTLDESDVVRRATLVDVNGRVLKSLDYQNNQAVNKVSIPTTGLITGLYFVSLYNQRGEVSTRKFVVNQ